MARKPNYRFARLERERNKAARKAARAKLKAERAELRRQEKTGQPPEGENADAGADGAPADGLDEAPSADGEGIGTGGTETSQPEG